VGSRQSVGPVATAGHRCPANSDSLAGTVMSKESSVTKLARAHAVVKGLKKAYGPGDRIVLDGVAHARDDLVDLFESQIAAILDKKLRYAEYRGAVKVEREVGKRARATWVSLHRATSAMKGAAELLVLGMKPRGKPGPKTLQAKLASVQKRAKKRAPK